ncbi:MAG: hypothetical protein J5645_09975 [Lachnospiraceae bacterium]|nr:hypothetical protein [Lachnospiraceae bacterium]
MSFERRPRVAFFLNIAVIVFAVAGTILMFFFRGQGDELLADGIENYKYFTVLSNEICGIIAVVSLVQSLRGKPQPMLAKLMAAAAVGLTFLVIIGFLGPLYGLLKMYRGANFFFHLILPLTAMAEFVFCPGDAAEPVTIPFWWTLLTMIPVAVYGAFYLGNCMINGIGEWPHTNDFYGFLNWGLPVGLAIFAGIMLAIWGIACVLRAVRARVQ